MKLHNLKGLFPEAKGFPGVRKTITSCPRWKHCLKNNHTKLSYIKLRDNLILTSKCFDSKTRSSHDLTSFQREPPLPHNTSVKGFTKRVAVQNVWQRITEKSDFVEVSNFIRGSTEAAIRECSGINLIGKHTWRSPILAKFHDLCLWCYDSRTLSLVFYCKISEHMKKSISIPSSTTIHRAIAF